MQKGDDHEGRRLLKGPEKKVEKARFERECASRYKNVKAHRALSMNARYIISYKITTNLSSLRV